MQIGWTIVFIIAIIVAYATMDLTTNGFWGKTAFVVSLPFFVPCVLLAFYSSSKIFGPTDIFDKK